MKKKIQILILMLVSIFALAGCGKEPEHIPADVMELNISYDTQRVQATFFDPGSAFQVIQLYADEIANGTIDDDYLGDMEHIFKKEGDVRKEYLVLLKGIRSYSDNLEDIGNPELVDPSNPYYYIMKEDGTYTAVMEMKGDKHDATIEYVYNEFNELENINVSVQLLLNESMKKAGVNTAIGMGTVFCMLILIMFIIMALGLVPKIVDSFKSNDTEKEASIDNTIAGIIEREEADNDTDDNELIAVIAAAIAAASGSAPASESSGGFVVRSIKRIR
ncbi:MAG: OadG family protein [Lachnospiraceae bacterium]|nr:OadG family protein [Lachnospiraceae bacterium]